MNLDTYESAAIPDVFVTIPSAEASAVIATVDKLRALKLHVVRHGYALRSDSRNAAFVEWVNTQIGASGYAVHGFDLGFEQRARARKRAGANPR
jgi:hypothetical protein